VELWSGTHVKKKYYNKFWLVILDWKIHKLLGTERLLIIVRVIFLSLIMTLSKSICLIPIERERERERERGEGGGAVELLTCSLLKKQLLCLIP
jgi:hypothetical protein